MKERAEREPDRIDHVPQQPQRSRQEQERRSTDQQEREHYDTGAGAARSCTSSVRRLRSPLYIFAR